VSPEMHGEGGATLGPVGTNLARVGPVVRMYPTVFDEVRLLVGSVGAQLTSILLLAGMNVHVSFQVILPGECLVTLCAWIGPFPRVGPEMAR